MLIAYLERVNPEYNERRFYAIYFVDTLLGPAVMRVHGRKGVWARVLPPVFFPDLEAAEPYIQRLIWRRLRRGYSPVRGPKGGHLGAVSEAEETIR